MLAGNIPVRDSAELRRIHALPRRVWSDEQKEALRRWLTPQLLNDNGLQEWHTAHRMPDSQREAHLERFKILLRPDQAVMLYEAGHLGGAWINATVGKGKTLPSLLFGVIIPNIERMLVIVPAGSSYDKTLKEFPEWAKFWRVPKGWPVLPRVITYNALGLVQNVNLLKDFQPDLVVPDEADCFKNPAAACTRVMNQYMRERPQTAMCAMTGTGLRKSQKEYAHIMAWCLKLGSPAPLTWLEREEWSTALDFAEPRFGERRRPGALYKFFVDPEKDKGGELEATRRAIQRRTAETPGVIIVDGRSCDKPLTIRLLRAYDDPILDEAFYQFRKTKKTQDGWPLSDPMSVLRHGTELGCGFYYRFNPRPPEPWLLARRAWAQFVRDECEATQRSLKPLNSEKAVALAYPQHEITRAWRVIKKEFIPEKNREAVWLTLSPLLYAIEWLKLNSPAIVWVIHTEVGQRLSAMTGLPFYGEGGLDALGRSVLHADPKRSMILSVDANKRSLNMQAWCRSFYLGWPQAATRVEQSVGRIHRQGQENACTVDTLISCAENLYSLEMSCAEGDFVEELGGTTQALLFAKFEWTYNPEAHLAAMPVDDMRRSRWIR
jgi:hypothetical protein